MLIELGSHPAGRNLYMIPRINPSITALAELVNSLSGIRSIHLCLLNCNQLSRLRNTEDMLRAVQK